MHTIDELREVLSYDPLTGIFKWKISPNTYILAGDIAGTCNEGGYVIICYKGQRYSAHRLAWALQTGSWPANFIDHKDRNPSNNAWHNLREATNSQNLHNTRPRPGKSGFPGVHITGSGKYTAAICVNKKPKSLGSFNTPEEAYRAYVEAKKKYHSHYNGGVER
jgi:hypothetical protein